MADFTKYDAVTHPIILAVDDYNNLVAHGLEKTCDYIIRLNGSDYEAITGTGLEAGTLAYGGADDVGAVNGADFAAVLQASLNNLPQSEGGGVVYMNLTGDHSIGATKILVATKSNVHLIGPGLRSLRILYTGADAAFELSAVVGTQTQGHHFQGFRIEGAGTGKGLYLNQYINRSDFRNLYINTFTNCLYLERCYGNVFDHVYADTAVSGVLHLRTDASYHTFIKCSFDSGDIGINVGRTSSGNTFYACDTENNTSSGIKINADYNGDEIENRFYGHHTEGNGLYTVHLKASDDDTAGLNNTRNKFFNCFFSENKPFLFEAPAGGASNTNHIIRDCYVRGEIQIEAGVTAIQIYNRTGSGGITNAGANTIYRDSQDTVINEGTATILNLGTSVTVTHGITFNGADVAPDNILVQGRGDGEVSACWVDNITATQFDIIVAGATTDDRVVYWQAKLDEQNGI